MSFSGTRPGAWLNRRGITGVDLLVSLALLVLGQLEVAINGVAGNEAAAHLVWGVIALAALVRRIAPLPFAVICVGSLLLRIVFELTPIYGAIAPITTPLAIFGLGLYARGTRRSAILAIGSALTVIGILAWAEYGPLEYQTNGAAWQWLRTVTLYLGAAFAGIMLRDRTDRLAEVEARVAAMPPSESTVAIALSGARTAIAREVHAVVERCLGGIASAIRRARELLPDDPAAALNATRLARLSSREAMDEMRRMLGLLRTEPSGHLPQSPPSAPAQSFWQRLLSRAERQLLIVLLLVNGVLNAFFTAADSDEIGGDLSLGIRLLGAILTALLFLPRRRLPLFTAISVGIAVFVRVVVFDDRFPLDIFIWAGVFVAGAYVPRITVAAAAGIFTLACALATAQISEPQTPLMVYLAFSTTTVAAWMVGVGCRARVQQTSEIELLERIEQERRRDLAARAIQTERLGVAREMHDLIGHGLTSITLQCAVVEKVILDDPERAERTLKTIENLTTEVHSELSELLAALSGEREPALPELSAIGELVDRTRSGGQSVDLVAVGDLESVPIGPSAAAYRIVQESLANASKYAGRGEVRARIERLHDRIAISIGNPIDERSGSEGFGLGIAGMRERAETYGGNFRAGPDGTGEWLVQAEVPLSPARISPLS
ncbi:MAG TPA: histidine kinase [Solirubrobacterales bacterium]|nr:histidine kinase [Solirubrobacterales bacterium]